MAMLRYGHAAVSTPIVAPDKWMDKKVSAGRVKVARSMIAKYDPSKWLLSHVSIIASVDTEFADPKDPKSNYLIIPEHSKFVNHNGDCWESELLRSTYKTFLNADKFVENVQSPELSKGKVINVALREVTLRKRIDGKDLTTLYVDILIATNRMHQDLIEKIISGEYNATSMGCLIAYSQCSQCGNIASDEPQLCQHVRYYKNNFFHDKNGVRRIVAELCGRAEDPESCKFVDASWVRKPAFEGAVLRNIVEPGDDVSEKIRAAIQVPSFKAEPGMLLRAASEAASTLLREIKAEEEAEAPAADAEPPAADMDSPSADETAEPPMGLDQPADPAAEQGAAGLGDMGTGAEPQAEPQIQEPAEDATVKEVEELFTKNILNKIRSKLLKDEAKQKAKQEDRPLESEEASRTSIVRDANNYQRLLLAAKAQGNPKLINGVHILSNTSDWPSFKKYGYTKKDALGLLAFADRAFSKNPVEPDTVKALANIKVAGTSSQEIFTHLILETGKKISSDHGKRILKWAKILSDFE